MNQDLQLISRTRKERITSAREIAKKKRKFKRNGRVLAGTMAAGVLLSGIKGAEVTATERTYNVQQGDTLYSLAQRYQVTVEQLKNINGLTSDLIYTGSQLTVPGEYVTRGKAINIKKGDTLYSIARRYGLTVEDLQLANSLKSDRINEGQKLIVPGKSSSGSTTWVTEYKISRGDTLFSLAKKYGTTVNKLKKNNGLSSDNIYVGQTILVPGSEKTEREDSVPEKPETPKETTVHIVQSGDTLFSLAKTYGMTVDEIKQLNYLASHNIYVGQKLTMTGTHEVESPSEQVTKAIYTIAPGETLWSVAQRLNLTVDEIKASNSMKNDYVIIGQEIVIESSDLVKATAIVTGAVDKSSVEFEMNGETKVLTVPFNTADMFEQVAGQEVTIIYQEKRRPALVSIEN
ncbi:LysM peptidoglycan-binding domain-containing protein [Salipaludibacillus agaradhaerens]|uniref:muramidase family protein n=1 Tax=Salipaludibacillus agaradhaerens TaxID=76935 RepID=UPI002151883E|nr:LysM peptidoglycan-binding domain-containing protein [Salipaludibacillus agaradhaerens]MCR6108363.1 LysM peptidoglycan-binding domain-containing protein [Salipaludibacillus agaradhaerens]MCR6120387.1 LysM peptidoglycan-binding domain-containing protein [Salipaludibacillus agaradhaerens]UJW59396.1 LysM peptidoglycan-binding domain-containing protein [Bacillus sp. A116_S68]